MCKKGMILPVLGRALSNAVITAETRLKRSLHVENTTRRYPEGSTLEESKAYRLDQIVERRNPVKEGLA